jgi:hypothetical protein
MNRFFDVLVSFVDMLKRVLPEALCRCIVFFLGYIVVGFVDELE